MASIKFIVKSNSDTASIYVRFKEGRLIDVTAKTKYIINSKDWSETKGQPKHLKDEALKTLNENLVKLSSDLLSHYNDTHNKLEINTQWLKDFIKPPQQVNVVSDKLIEFIDYYNSNKAKNTTLSNGTIKRDKSTRNLIYNFEKDCKSTFLVKDVDTNFVLRFEAYCLKKNYSVNYVSRAVKYLKTICFNARINDIEISNKVDLIKPKSEKVDKIYLTLEELEEIEKTKYNTESLNNVKDWLIISCETGQRVSDFMRFDKDMIRYENNKPLIEFTQVKTNKVMTIPLSKKVMAILEKRGGEFPKRITDQKYNDYLKDVCKTAKLTTKVKGSKIDEETKRKVSGMFEKWELVTSHIGRRSFATNNYGKIPTSLLIGATGHSTEKMFLEYIGKTDTQKALQLAEYF